MRDLNNVTLIGRLTHDVEVSYMQSGTAVANFAVAVNNSYVKDGQRTDYANFIDITLFGKIAESLKPYMTKGKQVAVIGSLKQDRWEKDGKKYSRLSVVASDIQLLGGNSSQPASSSQQQDGAAPDSMGFAEDIPF